jgi:hypothetical protein
MVSKKFLVIILTSREGYSHKVPLVMQLLKMLSKVDNSTRTVQD